MKKFQLGDTYGKTTADILTNDDVSNSTFSCDPLTPPDPVVTPGRPERYDLST